MPFRENYKYTPRYCEENVWHLCNDAIGDDGKAVFISNQNKQCPMWHQRAAAVGDPVIWDYHVVYLSRVEKQWMIFDLDTTLEFPANFEVYLSASFPRSIRTGYEPVFRIVDADEFVAIFCSDREHMRSRDGKYLSSPPEWPLICGGAENNLSRFLNFRDLFVGQIVNHADFKQKFSGAETLE